MKRDFDLIRKILLYVESAPGMTLIREFPFDEYADEDVAEHIELLIEAGLIDGHVDRQTIASDCAIVRRLTWNGHDFLDAVKDESVWRKAKDEVLKPIGGVAFEVLLEWLKVQMRSKLGLPDA